MTFRLTTSPSRSLSSLIVLSMATVLAQFVFTLCSPSTGAQETSDKQVSPSDKQQKEPYQDSDYSSPSSYGYSKKYYDPAKDPRIGKPDSIRYYGPGRTWQYWETNGLFEQETWVTGRDTWWFFTAGNERFYRALAVKLGKLDVSVDFFRLLDTRNRSQRFKQLGLINEPNFEEATEPDQYGFWLDRPIKSHPEMDKCNKDPQYSNATYWQSDGRYPADPYYPRNEKDYGLPTGIIGLRLYANPNFSNQHAKSWKTKLAQWNDWKDQADKAADEEPANPVAEYFANPGRTEPPYLFGISCALCHVAFDPTNPPKNPAKPRWEHLSANIGNQYFREGDLFFGWGRVNGGDANPIENYKLDPYQTKGLPGCGVNRKLKSFSGTDIVALQGRAGPYLTNGQLHATVPPSLHQSIDGMTVEKAQEILRDAPAGRSNDHLTNLLYHYGQTQQSGTSETSRFSYDFINNPNTINKIFFIAGRPRFVEESPDGKPTQTLHVLKDGADSVGIPAALSRVYVNIGGEAEYWLSRLWNPLAGSGPHPLSIAEMTMADSVPDWRKQELKETIPTIGKDWKRIEARMPALANYLTSYNSPFLLKDAVARVVSNLDETKPADQQKKIELLKLLPQESSLANGRRMFATYCACCHSSKQPTYPMSDEDASVFFRDSVNADDFLVGNPLTNDVRYPVTQIGTNTQRAFATNAIDGEIWADFSSRDYKALPSVGTLQFETPLNLISPRYGKKPIKTSFVAPGGGRGYYRTASLVSLWATAPYLHNNSVGRDPFRKFYYQTDDPFHDATGFSDDVATVETRMALFQDGIEKLLGLRPRDNERTIKLAIADASLLTGLDRAKTRIISVSISDALGPKVDEILSEKLQAKIGDETVRRIAHAALTETLHQLREKLPEVLNNVDKVQLKAKTNELLNDVETIVKPFLLAFLKQNIETILTKALQAEFPDLPAGITKELVDVVNEIDLAELIGSRNGIVGAGPVSLFFPEIPRGTPINLILNQNIKKAPYAVQALISHKRDPAKLAEVLLKLSDCPDIVEDHGHIFPTEAQRKQEGKQSMRDLIEFLKTL